MTKPLKKDATYEDLCAVPENFVAEILEGELYAFPRPAIPHAHAASVLGAELGGPFHRGRHGPGGWLILDEPELHFGADVLVLDIAGWRRERLPTPPPVAHLTLAPDWLCEVLSPSTESVDRTKKLKIYAREGVEHVWLVNPVLQTFEILRWA
jgi:Uma2 family endonuclease